MLMTREYFQRLEAAWLSQYPNVRRDSDLAIFVENQLKQVTGEVYRREYRELDAKELVPMRTNINPGAKSWSWLSYEMRGMARFIGANVKDIPRVDVAGKEIVSPVKTMATSYGYTVDDMEAARFAGVPLDPELGAAARRAIEQLQHNTLLFGEQTLGLPGLFTDPRTAVVTVPNGAWLAGATGDQVVADLNAIVDAVWANSQMLHRANVLLMPMLHYRYAQEVRMSNTTMNALQYFQANNPWITEVRPSIDVATAGPGGVAAIFAYQRSPEIVAGVEPLAFSQLPPQQEGLETLIIARLKTGGTVWYRPLGGIFGVGI